MSISCAVDCEEAAWYYIVQDLPLRLTSKRGKRCMSCKEIIKPGKSFFMIKRWREPRTDIEDKIYGEGGEVPLAPWHFCADCGPIYHALEKYNVAINIQDDDLRALLKEFNEIYVPKGLEGFSLKMPMNRDENFLRNHV